MKKRMSALIKEEKGVAMVVTAGCLVVLIAMAGLAIDVGCAYYNKNKLQAACDAAALAAANKMIDTGYNQANATLRGQKCFNKNFRPEQLSVTSGFNLENEDTDYVYGKRVSTDPADNMVTVTAHMTSPTVFAKILGFNQFPLNVKAVAFAYKGLDSETAHKALVTKEGVSVSDGGGNKIDGILSAEGDVEFNVGVEITGEVRANGQVKHPEWISGGGTVSEHQPIFDFDGECNKIKNYIVTHMITFPTAKYEIKDNWAVPLPSSVNFPYLGNNHLYPGDAALGSRTVTVTADTKFSGDLTVSNLTINEGATLFIDGDLTILNANPAIFDGSLYVTGRINVNGGKISVSDSKTPGKTNYIYCDGVGDESNPQQIGVTGTGSPKAMNDVVFCFPNSHVNIDGGGTTVHGSIYAKSAHLGAGTTTLIRPDGGYPHESERTKHSLIG